jgi:hypothetical protein
MIASLIAVRGHLYAPYPDDPRWSPWTRFIEREFSKDSEITAALARLAALAERAERLEAAIRWALGEGDDFLSAREAQLRGMQGAYYWRKELRRRAALDEEDEAQ